MSTAICIYVFSVVYFTTNNSNTELLCSTACQSRDFLLVFSSSSMFEMENATDSLSNEVQQRGEIQQLRIW